MLSLPDGTCYEDEPITDRDTVKVGDEFVCVLIHPDRYPDIHNRVITVAHVSEFGGIAIREYKDNSHFVRRCFHRIIEKEGGPDGFDEVFA